MLSAVPALLPFSLTTREYRICNSIPRKNAHYAFIHRVVPGDLRTVAYMGVERRLLNEGGDLAYVSKTSDNRQPILEPT